MTKPKKNREATDTAKPTKAVKHKKPVETEEVFQPLLRSERKGRNSHPVYHSTSRPRTRKISEAVDDAIPFTLPKTPRRTRIPAGVGVEAFPSPANLKLKSAMKSAKKKTPAVRKVIVDDLTGSFGTLGLDSKNIKTTITTRGRKDKEEKDTGDTEAFATTTKPTRRSTRTRSQVRHKRSASEAYSEDGDDDDGIQHFDLEPFVPPSLQQKPVLVKAPKGLVARIMADSDSEPDLSAALPPQTQEKIQKLIVKFQESASSARDKQLWEIEEEDVKQIEEEIGRLKKDQENGEVKEQAMSILQGMLDVLERFRGFREGFDRFLDDADKVGMGLDWGERKGDDVDDDDDEEEEEEDYS